MSLPVIVPARYRSTRLPGKPLLGILGVPMVVRTCRQCLKAVPPERLWVATDDARIADACAAHGIRALSTPDCPTGTDRVAIAAAMIGADAAVSVQGDEPVLNPADLALILAEAERLPDSVLNGRCPVPDEAVFRNPSIPKVVCRPDGRLLYASRAAVPTTKDLGFAGAHRQVCLYAFPPGALRAFAASPKTPLEAAEDIEILRFLELGFDVRMVDMSADSVPVDTPADIAAAEEAVRRRGL